MKAFFFGFLLLIASMVAPAQEQRTPPEASQYEPAIQEAQHWGRVIYDYDQAAAKATDIALANRTFKRDKRVHGWITSAQSGGITTMFIGSDGDSVPTVLYEVSSATNFALSAIEVPRPLSAVQYGQFKARQTAFAALASPCSKSYNTVVLPVESGQALSWRVYLLPGTTKKGGVPLGGYYRYDVSSDGGSITSQRAFTRSCLELANSKRTAALMVTHLLDPQPTEVHVFANLLAGKPLYVGTTDNGMLWKIENGQISAVDSGD